MDAASPTPAPSRHAPPQGRPGPSDQPHVYFYDAEGKDGEIALADGLLGKVGETALLWIDVPAPDQAQLGKVAEIVGMDQRLIGELLGEHHQFRVENYGDHHFFSVSVPPLPENRSTRPIRIDFVVGANWLVTVHRGPVGFLHRFREQDKGETKTGALSAAAFTATLLDWHLEGYFREVANIESAIDELDDRILAEPSSESLLEDILHIRRRVSSLRRLLADQRPVFYGLGRPDVMAAAPNPDGDHAPRLVARYERALDEIERTRELVLGSFDLLTSRVGQLTNDLVKALTFFTVIIGTTAAAAGLFGMNFKTPFFETGERGFFMVVASLLAFALAAFAWARHRRWL